MTNEELLQVIEQAATEGATELDLAGNKLTALPAEIGKLTKLKKLILGKFKYDEDGNIVGIIGNKMNIYGGYLECIDQWYSSSQLCHQCHKKKTDLGLKERLYVCSNPNCQPVCRDYNSAKNLEQAEPEWIINRVGSIRINVCGQVVADNLG